MPLVFVYGTLKTGLSNHRLLSGQRFVGAARTTPGYRLFEIADYPGMIAEARSSESVCGEVWEVDSSCLAELDRLEGVEEGLYERVAIPLQAPFDNKHVQGYLFLHPVDGRRALGSCWEEL